MALSITTTGGSLPHDHEIHQQGNEQHHQQRRLTSRREGSTLDESSRSGEEGLCPNHIHRSSSILNTTSYSPSPTTSAIRDFLSSMTSHSSISQASSNNHHQSTTGLRPTSTYININNNNNSNAENPTVHGVVHRSKELIQQLLSELNTKKLKKSTIEARIQALSSKINNDLNLQIGRLEANHITILTHNDEELRHELEHELEHKNKNKNKNKNENENENENENDQLLDDEINEEQVKNEADLQTLKSSLQKQKNDYEDELEILKKNNDDLKKRIEGVISWIDELRQLVVIGTNNNNNNNNNNGDTATMTTNTQQDVTIDNDQQETQADDDIEINDVFNIDDDIDHNIDDSAIIPNNERSHEIIEIDSDEDFDADVHDDTDIQVTSSTKVRPVVHFEDISDNEEEEVDDDDDSSDLTWQEEDQTDDETENEEDGALSEVSEDGEFEYMYGAGYDLDTDRPYGQWIFVPHSNSSPNNSNNGSTDQNNHHQHDNHSDSLLYHQSAFRSTRSWIDYLGEICPRINDEDSEYNEDSEDSEDSDAVRDNPLYIEENTIQFFDPFPYESDEPDDSDDSSDSNDSDDYSDNHIFVGADPHSVDMYGNLSDEEEDYNEGDTINFEPMDYDFTDYDLEQSKLMNSSIEKVKKKLDQENEKRNEVINIKNNKNSFTQGLSSNDGVVCIMCGVELGVGIPDNYNEIIEKRNKIINKRKFKMKNSQRKSSKNGKDDRLIFAENKRDQVYVVDEDEDEDEEAQITNQKSKQSSDEERKSKSCTYNKNESDVLRRPKHQIQKAILLSAKLRSLNSNQNQKQKENPTANLSKASSKLKSVNSSSLPKSQADPIPFPYTFNDHYKPLDFHLSKKSFFSIKCGHVYCGRCVEQIKINIITQELEGQLIKLNWNKAQIHKEYSNIISYLNDEKNGNCQTLSKLSDKSTKSRSKRTLQSSSPKTSPKTSPKMPPEPSPLLSSSDSNLLKSEVKTERYEQFYKEEEDNYNIQINKVLHFLKKAENRGNLITNIDLSKGSKTNKDITDFSTHKCFVKGCDKDLEHFTELYY